MMDKQAVREWRERWRAVKEIEIAEQRAASMTLKWKQLNSVVGMWIGLGIYRSRSPDDDAAVRERWNRLKDQYEAAR